MRGREEIGKQDKDPFEFHCAKRKELFLSILNRFNCKKFFSYILLIGSQLIKMKRAQTAPLISDNEKLRL